VFDFRYHVASLAAVFFALVIGILVGVALASHGLGNTERKRLEEELSNAQSDVTQWKNKAQENSAEASFAGAAYKAVMANRLQGKRVAVIFVGPLDRTIRKAVSDTIADSGAETLRTRAISVPIDAKAIAGTLAGRPALASFSSGPKHFESLGGELAGEFVLGGDTPVWDALENQLVEYRSGGGRRPADAVVVVRTATPQTKPASAQLVTGLFRTLANSPVPAVGVELRGTYPSAVPTYKRLGLPSVDDLDLGIGRVALAVMLAHASDGHYGLQQTDDALLPDIPPVQATTTGG
jgi:hypothetical protein